MSLPIYSVIILHGVTELPEQSQRDLLGFVKNGGGLWLIPDRDVSPLRFNENLAALLGDLAIGQLKVPDQPVGIDRSESSVTHPLFLPLLREEWGSTRDLSFQQYFTLQTPGNAGIALRAGNGDPLVVVHQQKDQRGLVLLQLFPGGLESSTVPRTNAYVPMVQQALALLARRGEAERPEVLRVGEVLRLSVPEYRNLKGDVQLTGPLQRELPLTGAENSEVRVEGLTRAGAYEVSHPQRKTSRPRFLTVNPVLGSGDLTPLGDEAQVELFGARQVARLPFAEVDAQFQRRHELLRLVLVLVFLAFAVEAGVAPGNRAGV